MKQQISIFWFRRDLRIKDNQGFYECLKSNHNVQPIFIFDPNILSQLSSSDPRVSFIWRNIIKVNEYLSKSNSGVWLFFQEPVEVFRLLSEKYELNSIVANEDYEPYAIKRDQAVYELFQSTGTRVRYFKDQVIFAKNEVLSQQGKPYTVFTPYKKQWLKLLSDFRLTHYDPTPYLDHLNQNPERKWFELKDIGFVQSKVEVRDFDPSVIGTYDKYRDYPAQQGTSYLGPHLRFGTISIRKMVALAKLENETFLSELIWREFFMQILYHYPKVVHRCFKEAYEKIEWRNNETEFEQWCKGETGYPMVDAGMRELNATGYMHNRVRMVCASFLCKHLLIDWRWGEAYFAQKLLDYELASNNGNWQWAAGSGCDAAPYFRVFNPALQMQKFDPQGVYIRKWITNFDELDYPQPMVDHKLARQRAIDTYKKALQD